MNNSQMVVTMAALVLANVFWIYAFHREANAHLKTRKELIDLKLLYYSEQPNALLNEIPNHSPWKGARITVNKP